MPLVVLCRCSVSMSCTCGVQLRHPATRVLAVLARCRITAGPSTVLRQAPMARSKNSRTTSHRVHVDGGYDTAASERCCRRATAAGMVLSGANVRRWMRDTPCRWMAAMCSRVGYPLCWRNRYCGISRSYWCISRSRVTLAIMDAAAIESTFASPFTILSQCVMPAGTAYAQTVCLVYNSCTMMPLLLCAVHSSPSQHVTTCCCNCVRS